MMKTAICDDEVNTRAYLSALVRAQPYPCEAAEFASADELLKDGREFDLLLLDVELGGPDGLALAREIRGRDWETQPVIVFVTGYDRYVFDAFDVGAFQYLLKPVDEEKFARVFARAAEQIEARRKNPPRVGSLTLRSGSAGRTVPLDHIYYIESRDHKVVLHLKEGELVHCARMRDLEWELQGRFFRIHKGYLVNLACVDGYSRTEVTLTCGEALLLSKYKYRDFVKAYLRFLKRGAGL